MQRFLTSLALTLALGLSTDSATALGLGKASSTALLGQPLNFTIGLRLEANESLEAKCLRAEVSYGDRVLPDPLVRVRMETASATGERRLRVSTTVPVDEPVVAIHLVVGCQASLSRNFTLLADPPGASVESSPSARDGFESERPETAVSPIIAAVPPQAQAASLPAATPRARQRRPAPSAHSSPARASVAAGATPVEPAAVSRPRAAAAPKRRGPVLTLDPVEADALILPSLQMDSRLSSPEAAASGAQARPVDPDVARRQQEQERLKAMESALLKLRSDSQSTQKLLDDMQVRVRAAEASRYANPLVYLLGLLCVLLAAAVAAMWWLRRRDRAAAAWWAEQPPVADVVPAAESAPDVLPDPAVPSTGFSSKSQSLALEPELNFAPPPPPVAPPRATEPDAVVEPRRPMSAEELIDLEQQAEFFVVLGQDDAAIDLLMGHVRSTGGVSPLPYLKLLEIYRRLGEREPYDRIRERFNRRFNAYAPEWGVDPEQGLSLDGYPEVMNRLQDAWRSPSKSMELLDAALFRRDAGPTFDVPAYRELLFLYSTARDLAERDAGAEGVDLLLPFGDEPPPTLTSVVPSTDAKATDEKLADELERFSLDLDVSTDQPPTLSLEDNPDFKKRNDR